MIIFPVKKFKPISKILSSFHYEITNHISINEINSRILENDFDNSKFICGIWKICLFFITALASEASCEKTSILKRVIVNQRTKLCRKILESLMYLNG
jgi:hypothetical protein